MKELLYRFKNLPFPYLYNEEEEDLKLWSLVSASILVDSWLVVLFMIEIHKRL